MYLVIFFMILLLFTLGVFLHAALRFVAHKYYHLEFEISEEEHDKMMVTERRLLRETLDDGLPIAIGSFILMTVCYLNTLPLF